MSDSVPLTTAQDEATSEERIQWLRDRGVIIEIPDEKKSSISSKSISASTDKTETITISVVKIPCNIAEPYEEVKVTCIIPSSSRLECFLNIALVCPLALSMYSDC